MGHLSKMVEISLWIILSVGPFGMLKVNSVGNYGRKIFLNKEPFFPKVFFAILWQNDANHPIMLIYAKMAKNDTFSAKKWSILT